MTSAIRGNSQSNMCMSTSLVVSSFDDTKQSCSDFIYLVPILLCHAPPVRLYTTTYDREIVSTALHIADESI